MITNYLVHSFYFIGPVGVLHLADFHMVFDNCNGRHLSMYL